MTLMCHFIAVVKAAYRDIIYIPHALTNWRYHRSRYLVCKMIKATYSPPWREHQSRADRPITHAIRDWVRQLRNRPCCYWGCYDIMCKIHSRDRPNTVVLGETIIFVAKINDSEHIITKIFWRNFLDVLWKHMRNVHSEQVVMASYGKCFHLMTSSCLVLTYWPELPVIPGTLTFMWCRCEAL